MFEGKFELAAGVGGEREQQALEFSFGAARVLVAEIWPTEACIEYLSGRIVCQILEVVPAAP